MIGHELVSAMLPRRRALHVGDASRFGTVRLVVQTQGLTQAVCSVVVEKIGGGRIEGTRLAFATISRLDAHGQPLPPEFLLHRALEALRKS